MGNIWRRQDGRRYQCSMSRRVRCSWIAHGPNAIAVEFRSHAVRDDTRILSETAPNLGQCKGQQSGCATFFESRLIVASNQVWFVARPTELEFGHFMPRNKPYQSRC